MALARAAIDVRKLPAPLLDGGRSVESALRQRRSVREYVAAPLSVDELSQLLWAAQGITAQDGLRAAPSAGALYPLETYVVVGEVEGLPSGVYKYDPSGHALVLVTEGDRRAELADAALGQECVATAPAVIVVSAVYGRTTAKYGERGRRYVHQEVGHAAQNVCLEAVALGLGAVVVGAFDDRPVKAVVRMARHEEPQCLLPVGRPLGHRP
jgi:SagB-type dehydrogenase family enzyme